MQHYLLLLNESLKTHIQGLSAREKQRLREKLEFIEAGIWDSGLRVKKLKKSRPQGCFRSPGLEK